MTIVERALQFVQDGARLGLGSGRAAESFVKALGERLRAHTLNVQGLPTSENTASLARELGIPLLSPADAGTLAGRMGFLGSCPFPSDSASPVSP